MASLTALDSYVDLTQATSTAMVLPFQVWHDIAFRSRGGTGTRTSPRACSYCGKAFGFGRRKCQNCAAPAEVS